MFDQEYLKKLRRGDCVRLKKWRNKKDGTKSITSDENVIVHSYNKERFSFRNLTNYLKDAEISQYGINWSLEPVANSYEGR